MDASFLRCQKGIATSGLKIGESPIKLAQMSRNLSRSASENSILLLTKSPLSTRLMTARRRMDLCGALYPLRWLTLSFWNKLTYLSRAESNFILTLVQRLNQDPTDRIFLLFVRTLSVCLNRYYIAIRLLLVYRDSHIAAWGA